MGDGLLTERRDGVLLVTLNRPAQRNAVDRELSLRLADAMDELDDDPELHVGVLTGTGGHFSAGMDLKAFSTGESIEVQGRGIGGLTRTGPRKPVVAAIEGYALAGGFEMALACDILIASETAVFGFPEVTRGLIAGSGGLIRLSRRIPYSIAAEYAYTGRRLGSEEAARWGIVNRVVPAGEALAEALGTAGEIARNSPFALNASKSVLRAASELSEPDAWWVQDAALARVFRSEDAREGAESFVEKREPNWTGR